MADRVRRVLGDPAPLADDRISFSDWVVAGRPRWKVDSAMIETALARAQAGDGEAFRELVEPYRSELQTHCYRILGSVQDAEDVLQEALLAAWRSIGLRRPLAPVLAVPHRHQPLPQLPTRRIPPSAPGRRAKPGRREGHCW